MLGIFLDIETTGLDPFQHRPVDIAIKLVDLESMNLIGEYQSLIRYSEEEWKKCDSASLEVNGFSWETIQKGKERAEVGNEIITFFSDHAIQRRKSFYVCQNPSFDRAFFNQIISVYEQERRNWPYHWLDLASMYWVAFLKSGEKIPESMTVSKNAIARKYGLPDEARPHRAMNGVDHLILCYEAVVGDVLGLGRG